MSTTQTKIMVVLSDRRSARRIRTLLSTTVKNLTRDYQGAALILDISVTGMRLQSLLDVVPGDALEIELPDKTLLAEAVYRSGQIIGIKLRNSLSYALLSRCVRHEVSASA